MACLFVCERYGNMKLREKNTFFLVSFNISISLFFTDHWEFVCLFVYGATAPFGQSLLIHEVSRSHTMTHHSR